MIKKREREREEEKRSPRCRSPSLPLAVAAARLRSHSPSLPLAFAAARRLCRSPSQPLAVASARLRSCSHVAAARLRSRSYLCHRRCCSPSIRIVLAVAASPSLSVAVDRRRSPPVAPLSQSVDRLCLESESEVGGKLAKFSQREFCLVTGLKFGVMSDIFLKPYAATKDGIHVRYFANNENIRLTDVWARFMAGGFDQPKDGLKMALVLIANNVLFGQDLRRKATLWLFQMVEDLEAFSSFPWGSYIWAMEAFGSLIDLVGKNLGHRHPRLKNWRIFKRPHDFFGKFAKYEKEVADGKVRNLNLAWHHVVLEELHPTDDEKTQRYLVGVDTDLSEGPQFIALNVELDDGETQPNDDVDDDGNEDGNDSGNDGSQSRPQQNKQKPVKRKVSPHKQKMPARTKMQRTSPGMSPVGDDSTDSSRIMREVMSAMSDQFEDIVKEIKKEISAMEDRLNARLTRVEASLAQLVNQHRQSTPEVQEDYVGGHNVGGEGTVGEGVGEGDANRTEAFDGGNGTVGKRVGEGDATLTEALDGGDGTVGKGVSRGDNDQGGPDSTLGGGDGTFTEGIVGGDDTLSEGLQIVVHNILLQEGIVVQSHPPSEDDSTMVDYLAVKNEPEQLGYRLNYGPSDAASCRRNPPYTGCGVEISASDGGVFAQKCQLRMVVLPRNFSFRWWCFCLEISASNGGVFAQKCQLRMVVFLLRNVSFEWWCFCPEISASNGGVFAQNFQLLAHKISASD
ncbi:hypothetical protein Dsin_012071 [Dipteronia sinensis]|uniref:DUF1985 domain-containing protein n=1 Tax=Dipteronia sinensis TaxID=43782 RepID=A0AAE0AHK7_9ROSI|nr:hypothetical protein Dsin_012071 [Dipteronia sinensis]